jgi:hypothetical protein
MAKHSSYCQHRSSLLKQRTASPQDVSQRQSCCELEVLVLALSTALVVYCMLQHLLTLSMRMHTLAFSLR